MTTLDKVRALFENDQVIECVENTLRPELNGTKRRIVRAGTTVLEGEPLDGPGAGKPFRMALPKRAGDVVAVDDCSVTYRIGRDDHTVTLAHV